MLIKHEIWYIHASRFINHMGIVNKTVNSRWRPKIQDGGQKLGKAVFLNVKNIINLIFGIDTHFNKAWLVIYDENVKI